MRMNKASFENIVARIRENDEEIKNLPEGKVFGMGERPYKPREMDIGYDNAFTLHRFHNGKWEKTSPQFD